MFQWNRSKQPTFLSNIKGFVNSSGKSPFSVSMTNLLNNLCLSFAEDELFRRQTEEFGPPGMTMIGLPQEPSKQCCGTETNKKNIYYRLNYCFYGKNSAFPFGSKLKLTQYCGLQNYVNYVRWCFIELKYLHHFGWEIRRVLRSYISLLLHSFKWIGRIFIIGRTFNIICGI